MRTAPTGFPTHALAIEWIRVNYDLIINVSSSMNTQSDFRKLLKGTFSFSYHISPSTEKAFIKSWKRPVIWKNGYINPQEATEAALLYILQNLI